MSPNSVLAYNENMKCPVDNTEMHQVTVESHYGQPIFLDQCRECGGVWFDETELFRARQGEAEKIEVFDTDGLWSPTNIEKRDLRCPLDRSRLVLFKDRYFPEDIILARCPVCNGVWLNRGEFTKFQRARPRRGLQRPGERSVKDKKLEEGVKRILSEYQSQGAGDRLETLERLGRFLSAPAGHGSLLPSGQPQGRLGPEKTANLVLNLLMSLFMAFILRR